MGPPVAQQEKVQVGRESVRESVPARLDHGGMQRGEGQSDLPDRSHGLHAASREAPAAEGQEPAAVGVASDWWPSRPESPQSCLV